MLTSQEIIERLKGKGMSFTDEKYAKMFFERNSYYRFRSYFFDYLDKNNVCKTYGKKFTETISFEAIEARFTIDEQLKIGLFTATKNIELTLRERIVLVLGKYGDTGYLNIKNYKLNQSKKFRDNFYKLIQRIKTLLEKSQAPFLKGQNLENIPIWQIVEALDFGCLSTFLKLMKEQDAQEIATFFEYKVLNTFRKHIMLVNIVRNNCAHHDILWNRKYYDIKPFRGMLGVENYKSSTYNNICILCHLTKNINSEWLGLIYFTYFTYFTYTKRSDQFFLDLTDGYGFPKTWYQDEIWTKSKLVNICLRETSQK